MRIEELDDNASQQERQAQAIACDDAFVKAMTRAISRGREHVKPGTFIDRTPLSAARIRTRAAAQICASTR